MINSPDPLNIGLGYFWAKYPAPTPGGTWAKCRDSVLYYYKLTLYKDLFYCPLIPAFNYDGLKRGIANTANFIENFQLESGIKDKCVIEETNQMNVLYIKINDFWSDIVRFSLLTGLLRIGHTYETGTALEHIKNSSLYNYFIPECSFYAVEKFMQGFYYTKFVKCRNYPEFAGWQIYFGAEAEIAAGVKWTRKNIDDIMSKNQDKDFR